MKSAAPFFRALADPTRWRIVRLVLDRALCVCELADILEMPHSSVSSHLQIIRKTGLLESENCGKWTYYRIDHDQVSLIRSLLRQFRAETQHLADQIRCKQRLADRANSCCPGPKRLNTTRKTAAVR